MLSCDVQQPLESQQEKLSFNGHTISVDELKNTIQEVKMQEIRRPAEMHFHRITDEVQGFGGYYIDKEGNYIIYLKEGSPQDVSQKLAAQEIRRYKRNANEPNFIIKEGLYGFKELAMWRELVSAFVLGNDLFDFVLSSYVNETINRVSIGVDESRYSEENITAINEFITQLLEIPSEAIEFEITTPISLESFPNLSGPLGSHNRPLVGGITLRYPNQAPPGCTIGFSGILDSKEVVITNSHCTQVTFGTSSHLTFFQPIDGNPDFIIGVEYKDPNTSWCGWSYPFFNCRYSDAAAIEIIPSEDIGLGYIARTTSNSNTFSPGSVQISTSNPVFSIALSSRDHFLKVGDYVHKVGRQGGWTSGNITKTCVDRNYPGPEYWKLICQYGADYYSEVGDSGSPVFSILESGNPAAISLYGIHYGRTGSGSSSSGLFSPMSGVRQDLGNLDVDDPNSDFGQPPPGGWPDPDPPPPCEPPDPCP